MQPVALVILLSLLQYWVFTVLVLRYRTKKDRAYPRPQKEPGVEPLGRTRGRADDVDGAPDNAPYTFETPATPRSSASSTFAQAIEARHDVARPPIVFVPAVWLFGVFVDPSWATALGGMYLTGGIFRSTGYLRTTFPSLARILTSGAELILLLGAMVGLYLNWSLLS